MRLMSKHKRVDRPVADARVLSLLVRAYFGIVIDRVFAILDRQNLQRNFLEYCGGLTEERQQTEAGHGDVLEVEGAATFKQIKVPS